MLRSLDHRIMEWIGLEETLKTVRFELLVLVYPTNMLKATKGLSARTIASLDLDVLKYEKAQRGAVSQQGM